MAVNKKILIGGCIAGILIGAWLIWKQFQNPSAKEGESQEKPNPLEPNRDSNGNSIPTPAVDKNFPLKKGSKNAYVGKLQLALGGLVVDNIFGNKTLAALKSKTGKTQVNSFDELQSIIDVETNNKLSTVTNRISKANQLLSSYKSSDFGSNPQIYITIDSVWSGADYSVMRKDYVDNGLMKNWTKGTFLSADDYVPVAVSNDGLLMVKQGNSFWGIEPITITIQNGGSNSGNTTGINTNIYNPNFGWGSI